MAKPKAKAKLKEAADAVADADAAVTDVAAPYRQTRAMRGVGLISDIGDQPPMRTLCAAVIAAGLAGGYGRLTRAGVRMLAAHTLATWGKDFIKERVDRTRPRSRGTGEGHKPRPGNSRAKEERSFPSGHSAGAAAVAMAYAREFPEHRAAALAAAGVVALAQVPRCAHYPTDIGVGVAIGVGAEAMTEAVAGLAGKKRRG